MNKIKVVKKADLTMIVLKSEKGQQLNENEVYLVNSNKVQGLLQLDIEMKSSSFKLIYSTAGMITMREYLRTPMNKDRFAWILQSILWILEAMEKEFLNQQYLLLCTDKVMVNPVTRQLYFVYVPIQFFENSFFLKEFLLEIIQYASFDFDADTEYVQEYIDILNKGINFSVFDLEEYVNKLIAQTLDEKQLNTLSKSSVRDENAVGKTLSGQRKNGRNGVYNPLVADENTDMRRRSVYNETRDAFLVRVKNGERVSVDKALFRIGKGAANNEYIISDNPTVSRSHAQIVFREGKYFLIDLNSTNKTFVDGVLAPTGSEVEIATGAKIKMSNEEFIFFVK